MSTKTLFVLALAVFLSLSGTYLANAWTPVPVKEDPLVRMPGTQPFPENNPDIESPTRCTNCHGGYDSAIEPTFNWQGSMMAQAARDYLYWSCLVVGAQDSIWAAGRPNATDLCLRCHSPRGWLDGRSDPTNGSLPVFFFPPRDQLIGLGLIAVLGLVTGILPAIQAQRLQVADAFDGGKKWIIRSGRTGNSRNGCGAPMASCL